MPQEVGTIFRAGYAYNALVWPGPTLNVVPAAASFVSTSTFDSGYTLLKNTSRIPYGGVFLVVNIPGPVSSAGSATGTSSQVITVTASKDGATPAGGTHIAGAITYTFVANVGSCTNTNSAGSATGTGGTTLYFRLPEIRSAYLRVQLAAATYTGGITSVTYGALGIALQDDVDTEALNAADLG